MPPRPAPQSFELPTWDTTGRRPRLVPMPIHPDAGLRLDLEPSPLIEAIHAYLAKVS
jgi:hypothetical protein